MTIVNCKECNKEFDKKPKEIQNTNGNNFCSRSCSATYNNRGKQRNKPKFLICLCCSKQYTRTKVYGNKNYCSIDCKNKTLEEKKVLRRKNKSEALTFKCPFCKEIKDKKHFISRTGKYQTYCKKCNSDEKIRKLQNVKMQCISYKGGQCEHCGYNKCISSLEFHHKDPKTKNFGIASSTLTVFNNRIKLELDKCLLLCGNCHREEHARLQGILF